MNTLLLSRGHALNLRIHAVEADLSAWLDEVPADDARRLLTAQEQVHQAIAALQQARTAIGVFAQVVAE